MTQKESLRPGAMTDEKMVELVARAIWIIRHPDAPWDSEIGPSRIERWGCLDQAKRAISVVGPVIREQCALIADNSKRHHEKKAVEVDDRALAQNHLAQAFASDKIAAAIRNPLPVKDKP